MDPASANGMRVMRQRSHLGLCDGSRRQSAGQVPAWRHLSCEREQLQCSSSCCLGLIDAVVVRVLTVASELYHIAGPDHVYTHRTQGFSLPAHVSHTAAGTLCDAFARMHRDALLVLLSLVAGTLIGRRSLLWTSGRCIAAHPGAGQAICMCNDPRAPALARPTCTHLMQD